MLPAVADKGGVLEHPDDQECQSGDREADQSVRQHALQPADRIPAVPEEPGWAYLQLPHQELPAEVSTPPLTQESFVVLCELIFEKEDYAEERQLFQLMMNAYNRYDP